MTRTFRAALALAWSLSPAANAQVRVTVTPHLVREHFGGPGFHAEMFLDTATPQFYDQVLCKRWKEMNPRFARIMLHRQNSPDGNSMERLAQQINFLKNATGTEVYLTGGLSDVPEGDARKQWADHLAGELETLLKSGATNIKWHCITNELSLHGWASLRGDLPTFRAYEQALYGAIESRHLPIKVLATDASPINNWSTIEWAAQNMDDIVGVYGGHHYLNDYAPDDPATYNWFKEKCAWVVGIAKSKGKDFILGEFGPRQYQQLRWGARWDVAYAYGTPAEATAGLQLAEAAMAAINAGVYAMGYWTFVDYPDQDGGRRSVNHWGLFHWMSAGATPRAPYYSYSLMTRFFRGPASVYEVETGDPLVRASAIRNEETGAWSIAVINRETHGISLSIALPADPDKAFRKYVYDPAHVPVTEDGDLQGPSGKITAASRSLSDSIAPSSLAVYTTAYHDGPPAPVRGLAAANDRDATALRWEPSPEKDFCYYRIFQNNVRIGSSTRPEFVDAGPTRHRPGDYTVIAVDQSGNASQPARVSRPPK